MAGPKLLLLTGVSIFLLLLIVFWRKIRNRFLSGFDETRGEALEGEGAEELPAVAWADELERIKEEKQGEECEREEASKRWQLEEKNFVAQLDQMVTALLSDMGRIQWGLERCQMASGAEFGDPAWEVRSLVKKDPSRNIFHDHYEVFSVRLRRASGRFYFSSLGPAKEEHTTQHGDVSEEALKEILRNVMRSGPRKKNEYEIL